MSLSMLSRLLPLCCALALGSPVLAEESDVYESLDDVEIGRVFLSPEQRARLDQRRGRPAAAVTESGGAAKASRKSPDAAGYIISSSGESRVWSDGDFVAADEVSGVRFPGDVRITRGAANAEDEAEVADSVD